MKIAITYIFHDCFLVKLPDATFLFDYPSEGYLTEAMRQAVISGITGTNLSVFCSHFHQDHFNRNVAEVCSPAQNATYIFSKDIIKKNHHLKKNPSIHPVEPDQTFLINDLEITTFRSNDEGVAFLIRTGHLRIYFGGDLANWAWEDNNEAEKRFLEDYFGEVLAKLKQDPIQIGFSNADPRLKNWAGGSQFIDTVKPQLFVPMHTFGQTTAIAAFLTAHPEIKTPVFQYQETGDTLTVEV